MQTRASQAITRALPLRDAVYERIASRLANGEYQPGSSLNEASLARELQVSRTPVREALLRLHAEGILDATLARGFTVRALSAQEASELYPILGALGSLSVRLAKDIAPKSLQQLSTLADQLAAQDDLLERWQLDITWHTWLVQLCGNTTLHNDVRRVRSAIARYELAYMREADSRALGDDGHHEVIGLLQESDVKGAANRIEVHWREGLTELFRCVERLENKNSK